MERRVFPIRTELDYAPTDVDRLAQALGGLSCQRETECRFQSCFQDTHHLIYGQDLSEAERLLRSHPDYKAEVCRAKHERVHRTWDRSEGITDEFAVGYLTASPVNLGANQRKRLKEMRKAL